MTVAFAPGYAEDRLSLVACRRGGGLETIDLADLADLGPGDLFGVLHADVQALTRTALMRHQRPSQARWRLTLLVPSLAPPLDNRRVDGPVFSFLASTEALTHVDFEALPLENWCLEIMRLALSGVRFDVDLEVVHRPDVFAPPPAYSGDIDVIIPHRGLERHLRLCVDSILQQQVPLNIAVALDQKGRCERFMRDVAPTGAVRTYQMTPHPVGPYVARDHLGHAGKAGLIAWQDSDDVSLPPRLRMLAHAAATRDAGLVGSHEIQVDEVRRRVLAVRYPLDASAALERHGAGHQVQFPTTLVRRDVFEAVGGFSTHIIFSLDCNFWLAASFQTRLINVDEFLYLRRRRAHSLTMRKDIGGGTDIRRRLRDGRVVDYAAVREGRLRLEESCLGLTRRADPVTFEPLAPKPSRR